MESNSPNQNQSTKDIKYNNRKKSQNISQFSKQQNMLINGFEHIENNIPADEQFYSQINIQKFGYFFKKDQSLADGPEYDKVCPLCGQHVLDESPYLVYNCKQLKRKFISHYQCLTSFNSQKFQFIKISQQIDEAVLRHESFRTQRRQSFQLSHNYYASLTLSHPISNITYLKLEKTITNCNNDQLQWQFASKQPLLYVPNIICIPYMDFKCIFTVDYKKFTKKYELLINLNRRQSKKKNIVQASTSNITLQMDILTDHVQKQVIVSEMNYIYPFTKNFVLIKFNSVRIKIPEQLQDIEVCTSQQKSKSDLVTSTASFSSPAIQNYNQYMYAHNEELTYYSRIIPQQQYIIQQQLSPIHLGTQNFEGCYNDIDEIIQSGNIKQFAKTSNGSRQFQKYLKKCSFDEVERILNISHNYFTEFITDDYANYMFQGLVNACSPEQRIRVVNKIAPQLAVLSQNRKGTYSLQTLITVITTPQQVHIVCKALEKDLILLSQNGNATHFIQKIIQIFQSTYLIGFFNQFLKQFSKLCKNSFGICVLKAFMKKVCKNNQMIKNIVNVIRDNLDIIIQDPFGNYIVQHAYDTFGQNDCAKITQQIINKFTQYCIQKFSVNVVQKCVTCCTNIHIRAIDSILQANSLEEILKTPTGNSILLKIVKQHPDQNIEQRIKKVLNLPRMSKYSNNWDSYFYNNNQKSATCKNINGQNFNNFSEAAQMAKNGKIKKGSYTPKDKKN